MTTLKTQLESAVTGNDVVALEQLLPEWRAAAARGDEPSPLALMYVALDKQSMACAARLAGEVEWTALPQGAHTALLLAPHREDVVRAILAQPGAVPQQRRHRVEVLHRAVRDKNLDVVTALLDAGFAKGYYELSTQDMTATEQAAGDWNLPMLQLLAARGFDLHTCDRSGMSLLHWAARGWPGEGDNRIGAFCETVDWLLAQGVPIDGRDEEQFSPLAMVAHDGRVACFRELLVRGANPTSGGDNAQPLWRAAQYWAPAVLREAARQGVSLRWSDPQGRTLLHAAVTTPRPINLDEPHLRLAYCATIDLLLEAGCDINGRTSTGTTPLLASLVGGDPNRVRVLLERGADPHGRDDAGADAMARLGALADANVITREMAHNVGTFLHSWTTRLAMTQMMRGRGPA